MNRVFINFLAKYHELGHALTNILIDSAVKHLVNRIKPDFFDGLGYLSYKTNDYYINEHEKVRVTNG
ncbi:Uncharacterized protein PRO82_002288 [Candidatus Protochlamydia amoebophila]|nr:Uncharacterized protein [Candidatus Protochlamydia amoebophila]